MNGSDSFKKCRKCGKMVGIIKTRPYRKVIVDADAHLIVPDAKGEMFVTIDGHKMPGRDAHPEETGYPAYRQHKCGINEDEM